MVSRRAFLAAALTLPALDPVRRLLAAQDPVPGGRLLGTLPLGAAAGAPLPPFGTLLGSGLDARLFTDLSGLSSASLITPNERFFVRTSCPPAVDPARSWTVALAGLVATPRTIALASLADLVRPFGPVLLECAGNTNPSNFGLLSAARWDGIPIGALLDRVSARGRGVLVSGVDDMTQASRTSVPGASWIFTREELERAGAFLATRMNGAPLPRDHGFPVRLIVPGWYGCACIKWVDRLEIVADAARPTTQMVEFAQRTHQDGTPELARDFAPAVIDTAAMPVRVEKWTVGGRIVYRVVGIIWGGSTPTNTLEIRFRTSEPFVPVSDCPLPASTATWSLWSHLWRPSEARRYEVVLRVADRSVRTRRLDMFFYTREVVIEEVS